MRAVEFFDIETYERDANLHVYCLSYTNNGNTHTLFSDFNDNIVELLRAWVISLNRTNVIYYCHNLSFDGFLILKYLLVLDRNLSFLSINYQIYFIKFNYNNTFVELRCSYKLFGLSLDKMAAYFLINELKFKFPYKILKYDILRLETITLIEDYFDNVNNYHNFLNDWGAVVNIKNKIQEYCERDVWLLKQVYTLFFTKFVDLGILLTNNNYSISSIAVKYYFKKYNYISKNISSTVDDYARRAYFGGRCEVFGNPMPGETILHYDFPGMYSFCMKQKFPTGTTQFIIPTSINKPGFYTIEYTSNMDLPILPVKYDKLYFLNGTNIGTFWFEEILLFIRLGGIINRIINALIYDNYEYIFSEHINLLEDFKNQDALSKHVGKLLINSLYGRLGMRLESHIDKIVYNNSGLDNYVTLGDNIYLHRVQGTRPKFTNVAISAAITAKARVRLYENLSYVHAAGGRLLYCDTDSIIASYINPPINQWVGEIFYSSELKDLVFTDGLFVAPKTYALKSNTQTIIKIKGVNDKTITFEDFKDAYINKKTIVFNNQISLSKSGYELKLILDTKSVNFDNYTKRKFINIYNTRPLHIAELGIINNNITSNLIDTD